MKEEPRGEIVIYETKGGETALEVKLEQETVWLSLNQMADLFKRDKSVISRHIHNIYQEGELKLGSTVAKFATVQQEGARFVEREVDFYNLDVIISVGYRVKSQRGTQFRIWASQVLKDHILKGYSINEKRLREQNARLLELQKTVNLMQRVMEGRELARDEATGLLQVITDYSYALSLLDQYDHQQLKNGNKRIGAFLFIWFLDAGGILYAEDGRKRIGDNALVALTLMIAESRPEDKDIITKVIVNLINRDNI